MIYSIITSLRNKNYTPEETLNVILDNPCNEKAFEKVPASDRKIAEAILEVVAKRWEGG